MLTKKDLTGGDDKPPKWFENWNQNEFQPLKQKVDNIEHRLDNVERRLENVEHRLENVEHRLDNIVKLNNLKE